MASWFDAKQLTSYAKSALTEAQKTLDKALDIKEEQEKANRRAKAEAEGRPFEEDDEAGETKAEEEQREDDGQDAVETASVSSGTSNASSAAAKAAKALASGSKMWGSFTGSFFDAGQMQPEGEKDREEDIAEEGRSDTGKRHFYVYLIKKHVCLNKIMNNRN